MMRRNQQGANQPWLVGDSSSSDSSTDDEVQLQLQPPGGNGANRRRPGIMRAPPRKLKKVATGLTGQVGPAPLGRPAPLPMIPPPMGAFNGAGFLGAAANRMAPPNPWLPPPPPRPAMLGPPFPPFPGAPAFNAGFPAGGEFFPVGGGLPPPRMPAMAANGYPLIEGSRVALEKLFPNVDLANIPGFDPMNTSEEWLANWMLDNMDKLPQKGAQPSDKSCNNSQKQEPLEVGEGEGTFEGSPEKGTRKRVFLEVEEDEIEIIETPHDSTTIGEIMENLVESSSAAPTEPIDLSNDSSSRLKVKQQAGKREEKALAKLVEEVISLMGAELEDPNMLAIPQGGWELLEHFLATKFFTLRLHTLRSIIAACARKLVPAALCAFCAECGQLGPLVELLDCYRGGEEGAWCRSSFYSSSSAGGAEEKGIDEDKKKEDNGHCWEEQIHAIMGVSYGGDALAQTMPLIEQEFARYQGILVGLKKKYPLAWQLAAPAPKGENCDGNGKTTKQRLYPAKDPMLGLVRAWRQSGGGLQNSHKKGRKKAIPLPTFMECSRCGELCAANGLVQCEPPCLHLGGASIHHDQPSTSSSSLYSSDVAMTSSSSSGAIVSGDSGCPSLCHSYCENCRLALVAKEILAKEKRVYSLAELMFDPVRVECLVEECSNRLNTNDWFGRIFARVNHREFHQLTAVDARSKLAGLLAATMDNCSSSNQQQVVGKDAKRPREANIQVELPDDQKVCFILSLETTTVGGLKESISRAVRRIGAAKYKELAPRMQRLFFAGLELENNECKLEDYGVVGKKGGKGMVHMKMMMKFEGVLQTFSLDVGHFDSAWNVDLRKIKADLLPRKRGQRPYSRPLGCMRYAIRVLGRYGDNDKWLGQKGVKDETGEEWPVAYHGTKAFNVHDILLNGFDINKARPGLSYGQGIYCTPNPTVAHGYAPFYYFDNKTYKLLLQCRVNPRVMNCHPGEQWTVPDGRHIRPYAICAYEA